MCVGVGGTLVRVGGDVHVCVCVCVNSGRVGGLAFGALQWYIHCICTMEPFFRSILLSRTQSDFSHFFPRFCSIL